MSHNARPVNKILVSACLYGHCTRYDGKNNAIIDKSFFSWKNRGMLVPVCPEVLGGLSTPRCPSEICEGKVISKDGEDVTETFNKGAEEVLKIVKEQGIRLAIMKDGSPSCGCKNIYDGTFSGKKIKGAGICARLLLESGVVVLSENDIEVAKVFLKEK